MSGKVLTQRTIAVLGSYGLACIVLLLLMVLTFFGTLEQADHSLYDVQKKYFESIFVIGDKFPVPLPGAYLLLSLLFVNLIVGGMVRLRKSKSKIGIFGIHLGIAALLVGGLVEFQTSRKGNITLFEGDTAAAFKSYFEWEVVVSESKPGGMAREYVVPHDRLASADGGNSVRMTSDELPFDVVLSGYSRNCRPRQSMNGAIIGVEGVVLEGLPTEMEAEANVPGVTVTLAADDGSERTGLLWGIQRAPWKVDAGGHSWEIDLRKRTWQLPFRVHLRDFTRELHPGTGMASKFYSDVTCIDGNVTQDILISMNEPLRRHGFTLYQSGWGPSNAGPNDRLFSTFAVVENPADRVPLVACIVIALGLLMNFIPKLGRHIRAQAGRTQS